MLKKPSIKLKNDTYQVLESLGAGGQGSIWKVRRQRDQSEWVMKSVLTCSNQSGREEKLSTKRIYSNKQRLQDEIDFLEGLDNAEQSYIVPCLDSGFIDDAVYGALPAWIMPYYPKMLEDKMPPYSREATIPSVLDILTWIKQIATALQATHAVKTAGITFIHRDIKATNIMLTEQEEIRLIDFGIARETLNNQDTSTHAYSPQSTAPEQMLAGRYDANKAFYTIGSYTDIYALGTVIYRLFTGISETEAQERLGNEVVKKNHSVSINAGGQGELGKIGGLSKREYSTLVIEIKGGLEDALAESQATHISISADSDYQKIAESLVDFVCLMLHADYQQRPSAAEVKNFSNDYLVLLKSPKQPHPVKVSLLRQLAKWLHKTFLSARKYFVSMRMLFVLAVAMSAAGYGLWQWQNPSIARLTLMANSGVKAAQQRLGQAYQYGKGVDQDWQKAWLLYQQAGKQAETYKNSLEKSADAILQHQNSTAVAREQAYQVTEQSAKSKPAGHPAQKWMEYRYRVGDGVDIDPQYADIWQRRYEGIDNTINLKHENSGDTLQ